MKLEVVSAPGAPVTETVIKLEPEEAARLQVHDELPPSHDGLLFDQGMHDERNHVVDYLREQGNKWHERSRCPRDLHGMIRIVAEVRVETAMERRAREMEERADRIEARSRRTLLLSNATIIISLAT